jgi:hypothetical protein
MNPKFIEITLTSYPIEANLPFHPTKTIFLNSTLIKSIEEVKRISGPTKTLVAIYIKEYVPGCLRGNEGDFLLTLEPLEYVMAKLGHDWKNLK